MPPKIYLIKCLYNEKYGGFGFSNKFCKTYNELYDEPLSNEYTLNNRYNPKIIRVFELLGSKQSSGDYASLVTEYIPEELSKYVKISDYDGRESVSIDFKEAYSNLLFEIMKDGKISYENKPKFDRLVYIQETYNNKSIQYTNTSIYTQLS